MEAQRRALCLNPYDPLILPAGSKLLLVSVFYEPAGMGGGGSELDGEGGLGEGSEECPFPRSPPSSSSSCLRL